MVISFEESFDASELELGLGLSLGIGKAKINGSSSSSSSSSFTRADDNNNNNTNNNGGCCGTKRIAEPSSFLDRSVVSPVVGWPPVKHYRVNSLINTKSPAVEELVSNDDKSKNKNIFADQTKNKTNNDINKTSSFVKVNMDGIAIGRKVDLAAHNCYETLARALDNMFQSSAKVGMRGTNIEEQVIVAGTRQPIRLLDGLSEFVLTYEDKDGDLMLVGDVPWEMFLTSVRRLRIMRTAEAKGLCENQ